jgi:putative SOS response-associated peptidase YedK
MCTKVSYDTNAAFRYIIKSAKTSEEMQKLHEQYSLWRENEPDRYLQQLPEGALHKYYSHGSENAALPVLLRGSSGPRLAQLDWGFIPNWRSDRARHDPLSAADRAQKGLDIGKITWNSASETMFDDEKRTWKDSAHDRRCVIFLNGYFAYHHVEDKKYPFYIRLKDNDVMAVAGLWDVATINEKEYLTCAILTQDGNETIKQIDNGGEHAGRMPIILEPENFEQWLDPIMEDDHDKIDALYKLIDATETDGLEYVTVAMDEKGIPDSELAHEVHVYDELDLDLKI